LILKSILFFAALFIENSGDAKATAAIAADLIKPLRLKISLISLK
jgi:hypothetical protein